VDAGQVNGNCGYFLLNSNPSQLFLSMPRPFLDKRVINIIVQRNFTTVQGNRNQEGLSLV